MEISAKKAWDMSMLKFLSSKINSNGGEVKPCIEEIFENLSYLTEVGSRYGKPIKYLPIEYKRIIFRLMYGDSASVETEIISRSGTECSTRCRIYKSENNDKSFVSEGYSTVFASSINQFVSTEEQEVMMIAMSRGQAESKALYNLGIGMEFIEYEYEKEAQEISKNEVLDCDLKEESIKNDEEVISCGSIVVPYGNYKGRLLEDVAKLDFTHIRWLKENASTRGASDEFVKALDVLLTR